MLNDDSLDRLIDETARAMTAGAPDPSLRARVTARLDERRPWWVSPWAWSPALAAALIAMALFVNRPSRGGRAEPAAQRSALQALPSTATAVFASVRGLEPTIEIRTPSQPVAAARAARSGESEVAALAPAPLAVSSLVVPAIEGADSIQIDPLDTIAPITLAPIGAPEGERR